MVAATAAFVASLGELTLVRAVDAEIALALARRLADPETPSAAPVARELHTRLADLARVATGREESAGDRIAAGIADELAPRRRAVAAPGP